jgi:HK97 family phage major capsid protein
MKRSAQLAQLWKSKADELNKLYAPYRDEQGELKSAPSAEDQAKITTLQKEIEDIKAERQAAVQAEEADSANKAFLKEWNTPVRGFRFPVGPVEDMGIEESVAQRGQKAGQVALEGSVYAGATYVQTVHERKAMQLRQLSVAYEEGDLGLDKKTLGAISSKAYHEAFRNYLRRGKDGLGATDFKTLQEGTDSAGGFLVPEDMMNTIISKQPTPTRVSGLVTGLTTGRDSLSIPKVNYATDDLYTSGIRVTKTGEVPASSTVHRVTDPVFGMVKIPVHTFMMSMPLTNDMVEDSAFSLAAWVAGKFSETVDLLFDNEILNGNAIGGPAGILLNPGGADQPAIVVSGNAGTLTPDGIINLAYSLPEQYDVNARFILNKTNTGAAIATMKDTANRYLFSTGDYGGAGIATARPTSLVGYPYVFSGFMPNVGANAFPIIFGDFGGYYLVNRVGFSVQVLRELYSELNQIVVLGRLRFGGQVAEPWKLKIQKVST